MTARRWDWIDVLYLLRLVLLAALLVFTLAQLGLMLAGRGSDLTPEEWLRLNEALQ
jgi:hypothetical protein